MPGSLADFEEGDRLPPCCQVPRELMQQVEENQRGPAARRKTFAACSRWLALEGHAVPSSTLRGHIVNGHASRLDD